MLYGSPLSAVDILLMRLVLNLVRPVMTPSRGLEATISPAMCARANCDLQDLANDRHERNRDHGI